MMENNMHGYALVPNSESTTEEWLGQWESATPYDLEAPTDEAALEGYTASATHWAIEDRLMRTSQNTAMIEDLGGEVFATAGGLLERIEELRNEPNQD